MTAITVRVPLRVSFVGGGTDIPAFYRHYGGHVVGCAIDRYVNVSLVSESESEPSGAGTRAARERRLGAALTYASNEGVDSMLRVAQSMCALDGRHEIRIESDIPPGSGLGGSSAVSVGVVTALHRRHGRRLIPEDAAWLGYRVELASLGDGVGRQDHLFASHGGMSAFEFCTDGAVIHRRLAVSEDRYARLLQHCALLRVGGRHRSLEILRKIPHDGNLAALQSLARLSREFTDALEGGASIADLGAIIDAGWTLKRRLDPKISNPNIEDKYKHCVCRGAFGGKLLGAGGAGYLLLVAPPPVLVDLGREFGAQALLGFGIAEGPLVCETGFAR